MLNKLLKFHDLIFNNKQKQKECKKNFPFYIFKFLAFCDYRGSSIFYFFFFFGPHFFKYE